MTERTSAEWTHEIIGGPWPQRIGKRCRISVPPSDEAMRASIINNDPLLALVLVENDPFPDPTRKRKARDREVDNSWWSCLIALNDIRPLEG